MIGLHCASFAQTNSDANPAQVSVKFYPNPAYSSINFDFDRKFDKSYSLVIFNFIGKKVYENKSINSRVNVNLDDYFRGIYIFQLRDRNGQIVQSGKFQVVK